jgi:LysM repeat protein
MAKQQVKGRLLLGFIFLAIVTISCSNQQLKKSSSLINVETTVEETDEVVEVTQRKVLNRPTNPAQQPSLLPRLQPVIEQETSSLKDSNNKTSPIRTNVGQERSYLDKLRPSVSKPNSPDKRASGTNLNGTRSQKAQLKSVLAGGLAKKAHDTLTERNRLRVQKNLASNSRMKAPIDGAAHPLDDMKIVRGFDGSKCIHQALDLYSTRKYFGTGQPVYAIADSVVTFIGTPASNPARFGRVDRRRGSMKMGGIKIPRTMHVEGYGTIYPFTRDYGTSHAGLLIETRGTSPPFKDYQIRYMHLAAHLPGLKIGQTLKKGEELGLMGATGVFSIPHLHLHMAKPSGYSFDPAPALGLDVLLPSSCKPMTRGQARALRLSRKTKSYTVKRGDSLGKIARKHKTTTKKLMRLNRMRSTSIRAGQKIMVRKGTRASSRRTAKKRDYKTTKRRNSKRSYTKQTKRYTVRPGDSLGKIAGKYGTTVKTIQRLNGMKGTFIRIGQKIVVQKGKRGSNRLNSQKTKKSQAKQRKKQTQNRRRHNSMRHHRVKRGESLWRIARKYKTSVKALKQLNGIKRDFLKPGMNLKLP